MRMIDSARTMRWVCAIGLIVSFAAASPSSAVADEQGIEAAKELFSVMEVEAQFSKMIPMMTGPLLALVKQANPGKDKEIDEVFGELVKRFDLRKSELTNLMAPIYAEQFSAGEIKEMTAFFRSEIGQKWIKKQPEIIQKSMAIGQAWGMKIGQDLEKEIKEEVKKRGLKL